jgi:hypothetical protein
VRGISNRDDKEDDWADETAEVSDDNLLWKQYAIYVDLFKFYVDITWKSSTWFYAITGAILAYYFSHIHDDNPLIRYALGLPIILSFGFAFIYDRGNRQTEDLEKKLEYIRKRLRLPGKPHVDFLEKFLEVGRLLFVFVGLSIFVVFLLSFPRVSKLFTLIGG